jgi:hypothetical protein
MANTGVAPVDLGSNVGRVRVLLGDTDPTNIVNNVGEYLFFSDAEVESILTMYGDSPKLAAARGLDTIAGSRALMLGAWSTDDLTVRGDAIAKELRELAKQLRQEALEDESSEAFNIIPYPAPPEVPEYAERPWWN